MRSHARVVVIGGGVVGCSVLVHLVSWIAPALQFDTTSEGQWVPRGLEVALLGWQALLVGNFAWLANILYFPGLVMVLLRLWRTAALLGTVALAVGLHTLALVGKDVPADEGGVTRMALAHPRAGFYLWMASMAVVAVQMPSSLM